MKAIEIAAVTQVARKDEQSVTQLPLQTLINSTNWFKFFLRDANANKLWRKNFKERWLKNSYKQDGEVNWLDKISLRLMVNS